MHSSSDQSPKHSDITVDGVGQVVGGVAVVGCCWRERGRGGAFVMGSREPRLGSKGTRRGQCRGQDHKPLSSYDFAADSNVLALSGPPPLFARNRSG